MGIRGQWGLNRSLIAAAAYISSRAREAHTQCTYIHTCSIYISRSCPGCDLATIHVCIMYKKVERERILGKSCLARVVVLFHNTAIRFADRVWTSSEIH